LSINDVSASEGDSGATAFTFTVSLSPANAQPVTVDYATVDGTATAPGDYQAVSATTLTFAPGETSKTVTVQVNGDTNVESDENFVVNLSNPTNAMIADGQGVGTIVNDDLGPPSLSIGDVAISEGDSGTMQGVFTVGLSRPVAQTVTVDWATADGTAVAPGDYQAATGTLTFAPGQTLQTLTVLVNGDTTVEPDETFFVKLSNATNAMIAAGHGQGTIVNDDRTTRRRPIRRCSQRWRTRR
jgi:large repetitive protein